jgi:hypothetical protein
MLVILPYHTSLFRRCGHCEERTFSSPGLRNRTERHGIQAVTMFTRRSGT